MRRNLCVPAWAFVLFLSGAHCGNGGMSDTQSCSELGGCGDPYGLTSCRDRGDGGAGLSPSDYLKARCLLMSSCPSSAAASSCDNVEPPAGTFSTSMAAACLSGLEAMSPADRCSFNWPDVCYKDFGNGCLGRPGDGCRTSGDCALSTRGQISCLQYDPENDQWMCQLTAVGEVGDGPCKVRQVYWPAGLTPSVVFECDTSKNLVCDTNTNRCVGNR